MRRDLFPHPLPARSSLPGVAAPVAVIGSIALALGASPAAAAEQPASAHSDRGAFGLTALSPRAGTPVPAVATMDRPDTHVVALGDTVSNVAARYGLRTADVLGWSGLDWSSVIRPGDVLALTGAGMPAPAAPAAAPAAPAASPAVVHTVGAGETAWGIAAAHGISVDALLSANGLDRGSVIFPGQSLGIPGTAAPAPAGAASTAAAPTPAAAPVPLAAAVHTVAAGDTISAIAARHGLGIDAVLSANGLDRASIIYPGQALTIPGAAASPAAVTVAAPQLAGLDDEQARNAQLIIQVGRERGVPDRGIAIALATAMVESWVRNLDWGDRDSLGLFQQRPSMGWGTPEQVRDAARSIAVFYGGPNDPNGPVSRGLLDIPGWESMAFTDAAQAVQISAFPERYGEWEQQAYDWIAALG